jgi:ubiquinone/menaquinone biosynthesis C-methylase UbiE
VNDPEIVKKMRAEWNERASEDAHYYVAFGRRDQDDEEFFATGADVVRALESELKRVPSARRGLEIGCGPGRLMRPMARHFEEIHGVDVADEMIRRAQRNLADTPNAFPRHATGSDLSDFANDSFDFVYSYAVFQHIPSGDVVFGYLREVVRVLKPGGVAHLQLNGLPKTAQAYTTWSGFRISADEVREFARDNSLQLLALDGVDTQYMWTTWRKIAPAAIRAISNAHSGEHAVPATGRLACASLWIQNLPDACDLNTLEALVDGLPAKGVYVGPRVNGLSQYNVLLPPGTRTGLVPVEVLWAGRPLTKRAWMRVIPAGPAVPRIESVTDGTNLLSDRRIERGSVKVQMEEIAAPESFEARVDGLPVRAAEMFCTDPRNQRYDVSFLLPAETSPGWHQLEINLGARKLAPIPIEVV